MRFLSAVFLALVLGRVSFGQETVSDEEQVTKTLIQMWDAIEKGDLNRYAMYLHDDFSSFGENEPYLSVGKEQELRGMESYLKRARAVHTEMHQPTVHIVGRVAWITYYWTDEGYVDGKRVTSRGKSTRIFVKEGDRWLCVHGHYTAVD